MNDPDRTPVLNGVDLAALRGTITAIEERPELGGVEFRAASRWVSDRRVVTAIDGFAAGGAEHRRERAHELVTDLPRELLGTDRGPSPLELALASLTSCVTTTLVAHAAARGVELEELSVDTGGGVDLRGVLDLADGVAKGYGTIDLTVTVQGTAPPAELEAFVRSALPHSPVLELVGGSARVNVRCIADAK